MTTPHLDKIYNEIIDYRNYTTKQLVSYKTLLVISDKSLMVISKK